MVVYSNEIACRKGDVLVWKPSKGMYGLKQAAIIAYKQRIAYIDSHWYYPVPLTTGLLPHQTRKTYFWLCVDNSGIKYFSRLCRPSYWLNKKILCNFNILGGSQLPWVDNILESQQRICGYIHARLWDKSSWSNTASQSKNTTVFSTFLDNTWLRKKNLDGTRYIWERYSWQ